MATCAQQSTCGIKSWMLCVNDLSTLRGLTPVYRPLPRNVPASGDGGDNKALALADMPTGLGGCSLITSWYVTDKALEVRIPPLSPNSLTRALDGPLRLEKNTSSFHRLGVVDIFKR